MTFFNRPCKKFRKNGMLQVRLGKKRISTKLEDTPNNRKLVKSYYKNDEFFKKFDLNNISSKTLIERCEEVLEEKEKLLKPNSYRSYFSMYNSRIIPFINGKYAKDITPKDIDRWYKDFNDRNSLVTCETILRLAFEKAILDNEISISPLQIKKPRFKSKYKINPYTYEELEKILNYDKDDLIVNFIAIACFTGLRTGEILALEWSDIDFKNNTINVSKSYSSGFISDTKTESSNSIIDLPIEAIKYFKLQRIKTGLINKNIFLSSFNKPMRWSSNLTTKLNYMLLDLGLERRGIYQTRHTFASLKLSYGERLEWVSYMLRHKSPDITQKKYYKYMKRANEKRVVLEFDTQKRHTKAISS